MKINEAERNGNPATKLAAHEWTDSLLQDMK
jgi:hypothetical protein